MERLFCEPLQGLTAGFVLETLLRQQLHVVLVVFSLALRTQVID